MRVAQPPADPSTSLLQGSANARAQRSAGPPRPWQVGVPQRVEVHLEPIASAAVQCLLLREFQRSAEAWMMIIISNGL